MASPRDELLVANPGKRNPQLLAGEPATPDRNEVATTDLKALAARVLERNNHRNEVATQPPERGQPGEANQGLEVAGPLADFLIAWTEWVGEQPVSAWEVVVAIGRGFAPRQFRDAAERLFGAPDNPFELGGALASYRHIEAGGLRLVDERRRTESGETVRRYRVERNRGQQGSNWRHS